MSSFSYYSLLFLLVCSTGVTGCTSSTASRENPSVESLPQNLQDQPNILWISVEDMSPRVGAFGDPVARTPNIDRLAEDGRRYTNVFTTAGVCSPSRAAIITGMHQSSFGAQHMRTLSGAPYAPRPTPYSVVPPHYVKTFTEYLRAAGYYTTNNYKEDYQFETPVTAWDESSRQAHWRNRPDPDQPFFSVFNLMTTHESRIWPDPSEELVTDPTAVPVPPYYPDTPVVRNDIARHYDNIADMDQEVDEILRQLEEDGLADNTIVFWWTDHGDGLPRMKRWVYDSGLHVPMIIRAPEYLEPGSTDSRLISFIDLAPTVLSLAGIDPPAYIQGRAFLGPYGTSPHSYIFAARDRFDEQYDMVRAVRDMEYKYIRNYYPEKPYVLWMAYANGMPTMQEMFRLHAEGELDGPETLWFREKRPVHELYDINVDPHEINNLAYDPDYRTVRERMEVALDDWMTDIGDMGHVSELAMVEYWWPGGVQPETEAPAMFARASTQTIFSRRDKGIVETASGGSFEGPVEIIFYCPTQGASIAYTTDPGENPHWLLYSGPMTIETTTTFRAKAIRYGYRESEETVATLTIRN